MKTYNKQSFLLFFFILQLLVLSCGSNTDLPPDPAPAPDPDPSPEQPLEFNYVFEQGTLGYEAYRIPAIVKTNGNILLAFAEARKMRSNGDSGDIDLVVKRSSDNGKTWSNQIIIWDDDLNTCGNPVPIVDDKGRVHLLMTWNYKDDKWGALVNGTGTDTRRPYYSYSDDEGKTWSKPVEITKSIKKPIWDWYGTGPVHGIQIKKGIFKNRLVSPNYFTIRENGKVVDYSHIAYSDDYGITWKAGNPTPVGEVGECSVAELEDGTLILNMRTDEGYYRKYSLSVDGGITWSIPKVDVKQLDAKCQGSILTIGSNLFLSNAAAATRTNMTIKKSTDNGSNWSGKYIVYPENSGYSDLVEISENQIGIFYEGGKKRYTDGMDFKVVNISSIK
ncbi:MULTISPECIES: sialidase family protein [unclassified Proteiniphilum]|jgi:sialidase-1|uniref:sialidase family protein n=1 Tax=unclassified Proteiniphilum TaxID=2622718 RepID=UPI00257FD113|nr:MULTISPECIES: sialidase family protein [unclassified Proteiniphilum]